MNHQTDVGISGALPPALASSVLAMLRLLTRLAVMSARHETGTRTGSLSMFCVNHDNDDLGPLFTPAVLVFASNDNGSFDLTAYLLVEACQSLWLLRFNDACERSLV